MTRRALLTGVLAVALIVETAFPVTAASGLTGLAALKVAYDALLNAQFARAADTLRTACGPAPREACDVLEATSLWWQILLDTRDTSRDAEFQREVDQAIDVCERWVAREPGRAEAWFYLGGAYGARVSWRVERGHRLAAARDGKRIKDALERALAIDAALDDARFGIGLYKYYADIAPTAAKILRFLLLLPGGDKVAGLRDMQATEARGQLVAGEALYQLHWIYFWYEKQPRRGLDALERLTARYPGNPHFLQRLGEVQVEYFHDAARSLAAWQRLTDSAAAGGAPQLAEVRGRLGAAEQLDVLYETDRAVAEIRRVLALAPSRPVGSGARAQVLLGRTLDRLGQREQAVAAYRAAASAPVPGRGPRSRRRAGTPRPVAHARRRRRRGLSHRPGGLARLRTGRPVLGRGAVEPRAHAGPGRRDDPRAAGPSDGTDAAGSRAGRIRRGDRRASASGAGGADGGVSLERGTARGSRGANTSPRSLSRGDRGCLPATRALAMWRARRWRRLGAK